MSDHELKSSLGTAFGLGPRPLRRLSRWLHTNLGGSSILREELRHVFPDSWAFFLGEIALYCFILLVLTGVYLAFFFHASEAQVVYDGAYKPLAGVPMSDAYSSVVDLSLNVRAGLLVRQVHHWAALVFVAAVFIHLLRMLLTGAYRRPRRLNWFFGLSLMMVVSINGLLGYSLPDDLLSGTGLRVTYGITESIPLIGPWMASIMFGGEFPTSGIIARIYPAHIFLIPAAIAGLLGAHLGLLWLQRHTEFPGPGRNDRTIVGTPMVPAYALRTGGYFLLLAGVITAFGAFLQINPVWLYGPYQPWDASSAAQPDWYMGWLEGAVRLFPAWDIHVGGFLIPAVFWPAVVLPGLIFTPLFVLPWLDWVMTRDNDFHNVLSLPHERPGRTAAASGLVTFLMVLLIAGGNDVFSVQLGIPQPTLLRILQVSVFVAPPLIAVLTYSVFSRRARRWTASAS